MADLTHLSLFSGIGGLDLAAEWAGFRTVGQCEWADYPRKVLEKHWPGLPRWRDIRTLTKESFYEETGLETVTVLSGGFPCQPFSTAGKRRGKEDDRYLWPEMLRVISELRPSWVLGENVAGLVTLALDTVLSDLENIGYSCQTFIVPACAVDAPHRRDRCAIVAYDHKERRNQQQFAEVPNRARELSSTCYAKGNVSFGYCEGLQKRGLKPRDKEIFGKNRTEHAGGGEPKPRVGGVAYGFSYWLDEPAGVPRINGCVRERVNRIQCLGNAVVPQQFFPIFWAIAEIESSTQQCCSSLGGI